MKKDNIEAIYPLSSMQQALLFHSLHKGKSDLGFLQSSCVLQGDLNISAFERAWKREVERHSVLRTSFYWEDLDKPLQVVHRRVKLPWVHQDWRGLPLVEQQERLESFLQADREQSFELSQAAVMRLALIQMAEDTYQFIWSCHHLLLDRWSLSLVLKEVFAFYEAFCQGQDLHLERPRPYRDYIAWLQRQDLSKAEAFWRQALKGFSALTFVRVVDRPPDSPPGQGEIYDKQQVRLSVAATAALQSLARQQQLTLNTLVQGAWALLLSRYSGGDDVVFGATVSGRPADLVGVESMVGPFINTLPVRVQMSPEDSLLSWLKRLQDQQAEARQYEYTPLVEILEWSEVPGNLNLFEILLIFESGPLDSYLEERGRSPKISNFRGDITTNYPLTLVVAVPGSELALQIVYDCHRFGASTINRMLGHFQTLLEGIAADPQQHILDLPFLTERERYQLLVEWNATHRDHLQERYLPQLFEAQVVDRPIPEMQIYLLDRYLQPVPVGIPGEVYIGSASPSWGYLNNRSELTAEKFIPNPFSDEPGARLYKTGDLARYLLDGNIESLGRIDHQVKIRGFRIELGEVEAVLGGHPAVQQVIIISREDSPGDKRLVAYVVPNRDQIPTISELRSFLKEKLPEYMVPSAFVILDAFPLTPNGKVDRQALPAPDQARPELEESFVAPRSPAEELLAGMWAEVLGLERVGIHDNFFDLGGHSLLATLVMSRVREALQVELSLLSLFETPTVDGLINAITQICGGREVVEEIARTLKELEQLSEEDAKMKLSE